MASGIMYLLTGRAHAVRLAVSLWSLRKHYQGPITVFTTRPESHEIGQQLSLDQRLHVEHRQTTEARVRHNSTFLTKFHLLNPPPYEATVYLDADTLVVGSIDDLLGVTAETQFVATRFASWVSSGPRMRRRLLRWRSLKQRTFPPQWIEELVDDALKTRPAINCGVYAIHRNCELLPAWKDLAYAGWRTFICDEIALQLLLHRHPHRLLDCRFNCSPIYAPTQSDTRIWHFHGDKHLRKGRGRDLWLPSYLDCLKNNVANIANWAPCDDSALKQFLGEGITK